MTRGRFLKSTRGAGWLQRPYIDPNLGDTRSRSPTLRKAFLRSTDKSIRVALVEEFGDLDKDGELLDRFSPSRDYDKIVAPLFVYAGQNDPRVPRSESDEIVTVLRRRGIPVEYMVAPNEGHSVDRRENRIELMTRLARFLGDETK